MSEHEPALDLVEGAIQFGEHRVAGGVGACCESTFTPGAITVSDLADNAMAKPCAHKCQPLAVEPVRLIVG